LAARISRPPLASLLPESLEPTPLKELSADAQEKAILDDLLFAFMGYEGQYIRFSESYDPSEEKERLVGPGFRILPGLDPSLRDLAITMLKMATHYIAVEAFVEVQSREDFGSIYHALCASIRRLLKEYLVLIVQMESQLLSNASFTLHVLHLHVLPTSHMLFQLFALAQDMLRKNKLLEEDHDSLDEVDVDEFIEQLREGGDPIAKKLCKGGNVLRLLTERLSYMSGDPQARKLLEGLLRDASKPYMAMLNEWLHHGSIKDPHGEFLIKEQKSINRERLEEDYTDEYWEKRYTIRESDVPLQLEAVKDKVLLAGKYLNVVRECGGVDIGKEVKDVPRSFDDPKFLKNVSDAYAHANSSLLNLLLTTHALPARLRSMKHYFFLDRSDFFSYFLYLSNSELKKNVKDVNVGKLQSLLDLVLRQSGSVAAQDPFKEDVKIHMNDQNLTKFLMGVVNVRGFEEGMDESMERRRTPAIKDDPEEDSKMTGFGALEFKYSVPFPLSLVISSKTVVRYQILFRYLLSMRHLEGLIVNSWEDHNKIISWIHKSNNKKLEMWKRRAWTLRARMLNFVQQFMYYCTSEVIEPNWHNLMGKVNGRDGGGKAPPQHVNRTVDELMEDHVDFLDTCLKECMLMNSKLLKVPSPPFPLRHSYFHPNLANAHPRPRSTTS
jgi:gamma-tubulin complex component 2